jgi:hypothetical protein
MVAYILSMMLYSTNDTACVEVPFYDLEINGKVEIFGGVRMVLRYHYCCGKVTPCWLFYAF